MAVAVLRLRIDLPGLRARERSATLRAPLIDRACSATISRLNVSPSVSRRRRRLPRSHSETLSMPATLSAGEISMGLGG
jgi:hypothetical protein